jgi:hypothetical protein
MQDPRPRCHFVEESFVRMWRPGARDFHDTTDAFVDPESQGRKSLGWQLEEDPRAINVARLKCVDGYGDSAALPP